MKQSITFAATNINTNAFVLMFVAANELYSFMYVNLWTWEIFTYFRKMLNFPWRIYSYMALVGRSVVSSTVCVCVSVLALKGKRLEISTPTSMKIYSVADRRHAFTLRSEDQKTRSRRYQVSVRQTRRGSARRYGCLVFPVLTYRLHDVTMSVMLTARCLRRRRRRRVACKGRSALPRPIGRIHPLVEYIIV